MHYNMHVHLFGLIKSLVIMCVKSAIVVKQCRSCDLIFGEVVVMLMVYTHLFWFVCFVFVCLLVLNSILV